MEAQENKGCVITEWQIQTRFAQEVKIEPMILVPESDFSPEELDEFFKQWQQKVLISER